jgi:hypothetical protein
MARMLGVCQRDWCPGCRRPSGIDCPSIARSKGQARAAESRAWRREATRQLLDD